ncbi:MAG: hypothetical protein JM58_02940 [Peptococcaceae bacterium BICA1-8]|nr:MAG: hypothetical protein JM58_02940 [Peptococcaceae bacterium BICA1-8]
MKYDKPTVAMLLGVAACIPYEILTRILVFIDSCTNYVGWMFRKRSPNFVSSFSNITACLWRIACKPNLRSCFKSPS